MSDLATRANQTADAIEEHLEEFRRRNLPESDELVAMLRRMATELENQQCLFDWIAKKYPQVLAEAMVAMKTGKW